MAVDEAGVTRLVERVVEGRPTTETIMGVVEGVPDTSRYLLVRVGGATTPVRVWRPAMPTLPVVGDRVSLVRGAEGYLVVDKVLDRDPDIVEMPEVPEPLDLTDLVALGVAPAEDLERHAGTGHLVTWNSQNTMAVDDGEWALMATGSISQRYGEVVFEATISGAGSNGTTWTRGRIRRIRQQADWGTNPTVRLELLDPGDLVAADVSLVVMTNAGPSTFELHLRVTREYEWATWTPTHTWARAEYADWEWTGCGDFAASLPAGTATTASLTTLTDPGWRYVSVGPVVTLIGSTTRTTDLVVTEHAEMAAAPSGTCQAVLLRAEVEHTVADSEASLSVFNWDAATAGDGAGSVHAAGRTYAGHAAGARRSAPGMLVTTGGTNNRQFKYSVDSGVAGTVTYLLRLIGYWVEES